MTVHELRMTVKKKTRGPKTQVRKTQGRITQARKFTIEDLKGTMRMNTTAGNVAEKDKDKVVEKRRALGRGLAALFSGPRVVGAPGTNSPSGGLRPDLGGSVVAAEAAELRSAGQPGAAVPTPTITTPAVPTQLVPTQAEEQQIPRFVGNH